MLTTNTMRYGTDEFSFDYSGKVMPNEPWDFTNNVSSVDGFTITGSQGTGTDRRAIFKVDGSYYKLTVVDGVATPSAVTDEDIDTILADGNTMEELASVTSVAAWVGKEVYPIFALYADGGTDANEFPTLSVTAKYTANADQYVKTEYSQEIELAASPVVIASTTVGSTTSDGNTVEITASLYNNGAWSEYKSLENIINETATKIKIKAVYTVRAIGVGTAELEFVRIGTRSGSNKTSSADSVIITNTRDLGMAAKFVRTSIVHDRLKDAEITALVAFRNAPLTRTLYHLGTATGTLQTFSLPDADIIPGTIKVIVGNSSVYGFDYNTETKTITLTAEAGKEVFVTYDYGAGHEEWLPMLAVGTQVYEKDKRMYNSSFSYSLPDAEADREIAAIKFLLRQLPGTETENLGTATGKQQMFALKHNAKAETLSIPGAIFNYNEDTNVVTLVATAGTALAATYDYNGVPPVCYGYVVAWND